MRRMTWLRALRLIIYRVASFPYSVVEYTGLRRAMLCDVCVVKSGTELQAGPQEAARGVESPCPVGENLYTSPGIFL